MDRHFSGWFSAFGRHGFTLIELLVVISIVAVMVSLLMPALSSARRSAVKVRCASHQRQVGLAFRAYGNDYANVYPIWQGAETDKDGEAHHWAPFLADEDYLSNIGVCFCPSLAPTPELATSLGLDRRWDMPDGSRPKIGQATYGVRYSLPWAIQDKEEDATFRGAVLSDVPDLSDTVFILDSCDYGQRQIGRLVPGTPWSQIDFRHQGQSNGLYLDGHVEGRQLEEIRDIIPPTENFYYWTGAEALMLY